MHEATGGSMTVTIQLTEQEFQILSGLLDAGVRASGLRAVKDTAALLVKLEEAVAASSETGNI
jgi:hypothetical protein